MRISLAVILLAAGMSVRASSAPLEAYGNLQTLDNVRISPDGQTLAYVTVAGGQRLVVIHSLQKKDQIDGLKIGDLKLRDLSWADSKHLIITTSTTALPMGMIGTREEWSTSQSFDIETHKDIKLLDKGPSDVQTMNVIAGLPRARNVDGRIVVFVGGFYFPGTEGRRALFEVDLDNGRTRLVKGGGEDTDWIVDEQGGIVAQSDYTERTHEWTLKVNAGDSLNTVLEVPAAIEIPDMDGLTADGSAVVVSMPSKDGYEHKHVLLKDGSITPVDKNEPDLNDDIHAHGSDRIIGGIRYTDKTDYVFFQPRAESVWKSIKTAYYSATNVEMVSWTDDWNEVVVRVWGPNDGDRYDLVNMTTHQANPIGNAYRDIGPADVSPVQWITYTAKDGRSISGYLTLPANRPPKNLPLVVLPHGGPQERDYPGFDWLSQGIASRGYAVLQPQFRGSAGFGWNLLSAGFGEFGRKMQTDLSDGVRDLVAKGIVDPKRVCIVGASYGGYAALAGAAFDPGVYRCAASDAGISDLHEMLDYMQREAGRSDNLNIRFWDRFLGVADTDDAALDAISPIKHVDNITIPILLIHGTNDTVVPRAQSEDMADALKKAGKPVEYVELEGEDHWLSRSETRFRMLSATVKFLEANNPPN